MNQPPHNLKDSQFNIGSEDNKNAKVEQEALEDYKNSILKSILEPDAFERLKRVALVKPENVKAAETQIIRIWQQGLVSGLITEEAVRSILEKINKSTSSDKLKKIEFRRKYVESDDEI